MKLPVYRRVFPTLIRKSYTFDAAHQLPNHSGKCARLHGHTYKVHVYVQGEVRPVEADAHPEEGMVLDFAYLSDVYRARIHDVLDHKFLVPIMHPAVKVIGADRALTLDAKLSILYADSAYTLPYHHVALLNIENTTAELLARWILERLLEENMGVQRVTLYETPTSRADVRFDGNRLEKIDEVDRPDL